MPKVNGKHYSYTPKGIAMDERAKKKRKVSGKSYSRDHIKMAQKMMK